jgi:hypothetical protein
MRWAAMGAIRSMSRSMPEDLVMTENGCLNSLSTSITRRVMPSLRSAGWYASVAEPMLSIIGS